ncbi:LysR family transcriptional regulator [Alteromonas sp. KUL49]|uniref:LysR family transcriptional regulator n=1 Tax=Alteromonas sp. KUL49 TaxID=2480798 RepID=UPI00102EF8DD|nr:LysR family transcriptional regulator [Alteromonas sp. KUL49]TAP42356.1 LysR family transcriptional regulator [Alteromonas sp. KUL49]GEA09971.1 LysR family transcriptional regulator [Alteromonas sp. KUL49]
MNIKLLRSLQVFIEVADSGSMSVAARNLQMTVSAISQQLRKLENDIGLSLFNRNTRNLSLTEAGHIYYDTSKSMLSTALIAQDKIASLQDAPSGRINIVAPEGFGGGLLSQPIQKLVSDFPQVNVSLTLTDESTDIISSGADLLLCFAPMSDSNFSSLKLATWKQILCVATDHPLADADHTDPRVLQSHTYIAHRHIDDYQMKKDKQEDVSLTSARIDVNSMQTMIQLTQDGLGYAVLPEPEVRHLLANKQMCHLFPSWSLPDYTVYAVTPKSDRVPAKTRAAVSYLQDWFSSI